MPIFAPRWLLLVIPPYLANVLSGHDPQNTLWLHYGLLLLFPMTVAAGVGARKFLQKRAIKPEWALAAMLPALVLGFVIGRFPPALRADASLYSHPNVVAELQAATAVIPADAPVQADDGLAVWLANRHTINDFPDKVAPADYIVIDRQAYLSGPTLPDERLAAIEALPTSGRTVLYDDGRFVVWSPAGGD
jgi:hypothetical protein